MISREYWNQVREVVIELVEYKLKRGDQFKYLESIITQDNDLKKEISMRLQSANRCFYGLKKWFGSKAIFKNLIVRMYLTT